MSLLAASGARGFAIRGGHPWGMYEAEQVLREFAVPRRLPRSAFDISRWDDKENIQQFCQGKCDLLVHRNLPDPAERALLQETFPPTSPQPRIVVGAYGRVVAVVNQYSPVQSLSLGQIRRLLMMEKPITHWNDLGGGSGLIKCYGEQRDAPSRLIIRHACMMLGPKHPTGYYLYREDFVQCEDADEVIQKVQKDQSAIGFILYNGQTLPRNVKLLAIGVDDTGPFIAPAQAPRIQPDYPLQEPLVLYLHPDAPDLARQFVDFCVSEEGSQILSRRGYITPLASQKAEAEQRLAQMKAGQGPRLEVAGNPACAYLMRDLAVHYTRNHAVLRINYTARKEEWAVGDFLNEKELLLLGQPVESLQLNPILKQKWDEANQGRQLTIHRIGGRGVAVVVHSLNRLDSLTIGQLQSIFSGRVQDWRALGAFDEQTTDTAIRCYGPDARDPAFILFHQKIDARDSGRLQRKKDAQEILSAVAMDPQAIGFVNIADLPEDPQRMGLRILAIDGRTGRIPPTADAVLDGRYPISELLYLYVHSRATNATREFVNWLLVPGEFTTAFNSNGFVSTPALQAVEALALPTGTDDLFKIEDRSR